MKLMGSEELQLLMMSYLTPRDVANMQGTCRSYSYFVSGRKSNYVSVFEKIWREFCVHTWGLNIKEARSLPTECHGLTFKELYSFCWPLCEEFISFDTSLKTKNNAVSFRGAVGLANRSVQATMSLPLFQREKTDKNWMLNVCHYFFEKYRSNEKKNRSRAWSFEDVTEGINCCGKCNQFSMPFWDNHTLTLSITPRFIAYYEVDIQAGMGRVSSSSHLSSQDLSAMETPVSSPTAGAMLEEPSAGSVTVPLFGYHGNDYNTPDCIAVGLASDKFLFHEKLPGWDEHSYGYHSDDGAIFHGRGRQLSSYGPTFGVGDVVGCGIDYVRGTIFFTLNGESLGTAFDKLGESQFRPTIGVDARVNIIVNFGRTPFRFDLAAYIETQEK